MVCRVFDDCMYHGEICVVEQVWDDAELGLSFAMLRPVSPDAICPSGTYIVTQDEVYRIPIQGGSK